METKQMRKKRYTEEQIVRILGESEAGATVEDLVRKYGVSRNTIYHWRSRYGGMEVSDVRRMKELEQGTLGLSRSSPIKRSSSKQRRHSFIKNWQEPALAQRLSPSRSKSMD